MTKRQIAQDGLSSANLHAALNRVPAAGQTLQKGLTAANLQAALASPPPPPPPQPVAPAQSGGTGSSKPVSR